MCVVVYVVCVCCASNDGCGVGVWVPSLHPRGSNFPRPSTCSGLVNRWITKGFPGCHSLMAHIKGHVAGVQRHAAARGGELPN